MTASETTEFDPAARRLCPDGACTGLVNDAGRCSECGKHWGEVTAVADLRAGESFTTEAEAPDDLDIASSAISRGEGFDPQRRLCVDGNCTGVIGPDNRCSECGRTDSLGSQE